MIEIQRYCGCDLVWLGSELPKLLARVRIPEAAPSLLLGMDKSGLVLGVLEIGYDVLTLRTAVYSVV